MRNIQEHDSVADGMHTSIPYETRRAEILRRSQRDNKIARRLAYLALAFAVVAVFSALMSHLGGDRPERLDTPTTVVATHSALGLPSGTPEVQRAWLAQYGTGARAYLGSLSNALDDYYADLQDGIDPHAACASGQNIVALMYADPMTQLDAHAPAQWTMGLAAYQQGFNQCTSGQDATASFQEARSYMQELAKTAGWI